MEPLQDFISKTAKSKIAVIVPLFGYWNTVKDNPLGLDTLRITLDRIQSNTHNMYMYFVAEAPKTPTDIGNELVVRSHAGNTQGVAMRNGASYAEYVRDGLRAAMTETDAAYFIVVNPWIVLQKKAIDIMVDRINQGDSAKLISGYCINKDVDPNSTTFAEAFDGYVNNTPKEEREVNSNFMGISRYALEMCNMDENLKTHRFMEYDLWQQMFKMQFEAVSSQNLPMYVLDVDMDMYQDPEALETDKQYFVGKWGFLPEL